jgi:hypothetical protein
VFGEARPAIDVDAVVVSSEGHPQTQLSHSARAAGIEPLLAGDARARDAVADGARVGREARR